MINDHITAGSTVMYTPEGAVQPSPHFVLGRMGDVLELKPLRVVLRERVGAFFAPATACKEVKLVQVSKHPLMKLTKRQVRALKAAVDFMLEEHPSADVEQTGALLNAIEELKQYAHNKWENFRF